MNEGGPLIGELEGLCLRFTKDYSDCVVSGRAIFNALARGGITSINDLKRTSAEDISKIRHIGGKKLTLILKMKGAIKND